MPWLKAFHVVFVVTWFAGLFYLPRLFVYHVATTDAPGVARFIVMERRLFFLMSLGALLAVLFGIAMIVAAPAYLAFGWLRAKLLLVAAAGRLPRAAAAADARAALPGRRGTRSAGTACSTSCRGCCWSRSSYWRWSNPEPGESAVRATDGARARYQILTRSSGLMYSLSPGCTSKAPRTRRRCSAAAR